MKRHFTSLAEFLSAPGVSLTTGPIAVILVEDDVEIASTLRHHIAQGFKTVISLMPTSFDLPRDLERTIWRVDCEPNINDAGIHAINRLMKAARGQWLYYCYNAEYLFYPFCETRSVGEMLAFHTEERRNAMLCYVVDLYTDDLKAHPSAVDLDTAHLDKTGYYALARSGPTDEALPPERQMDFFGGLRWRFEEHVPAKKRKIDRIALFRAARGLTLDPDHTFNVAEYNTYACEWHNSLTAAICSFRTAKALIRNPGSSARINGFTWHNSEPFTWSSRQLVDLGLMEPGQWF